MGLTKLKDMDYPNLKVIRSIGMYSLVSSFNGVSHSWYIDNQDEVTEDIGILEADKLLYAPETVFINEAAAYFD